MSQHHPFPDAANPNCMTSAEEVRCWPEGFLWCWFSTCPHLPTCRLQLYHANENINSSEWKQMAISAQQFPQIGFVFVKVTGKVKGTLNWESWRQISIQALLLTSCNVLDKFLNFSGFTIPMFKGLGNLPNANISDSIWLDTNFLLSVEEELELSECEYVNSKIKKLFFVSKIKKEYLGLST